MDEITRCVAMAAFCRQRARMAGESAHFWLTEADFWKKRLPDESANASESRACGGKISEPPA
jgi:hypothetical protein